MVYVFWVLLVLGIMGLTLILIALTMAAVDMDMDWSREDLSADEFAKSARRYGYIGEKRGADQ